MAGRLDQYDSFVATARGAEGAGRLPAQPDRPVGQTKRELDAMNPEILFERSRKERLVLLVFYTKLEGGRPKGVRQLVVAPENHLSKSRRPPLYLELVDVVSRSRKSFRRDRISKVVPAKDAKPVPWDPSKVTFR